MAARTHKNRRWAVLVIFVLVVLVFYGMDHLIMGAQGLPLHFDLSPAQ